MRLYRVQTTAVDLFLDVRWTGDKASAEKVARQVAPAVVDLVEVGARKEDLVELLNLATAHRDALAQVFDVSEVRRYER